VAREISGRHGNGSWPYEEKAMKNFTKTAMLALFIAGVAAPALAQGASSGAMSNGSMSNGSMSSGSMSNSAGH
jgi:hypothetical protein